MKAEKTVYLSLRFTDWNSRGYADVTRTAFYSFSDDSRIDTLLEFQQNSKKIITETIRRAEAGDNFSLCLSVCTCHGGDDFTCYGWTSCDPLSVAEDDRGKRYVHLDADTSTSTPERWDMVLYPDIIKSLAEAHC